MATDVLSTIMHSEGMTKPQIQGFVITFTLGDLQSDQYRRLGFQHVGGANTLALNIFKGVDCLG